ncbi:MAG: hypothetical protein AAF533_18305 [Acidobacteriota bacterium]
MKQARPLVAVLLSLLVFATSAVAREVLTETASLPVESQNFVGEGDLVVELIGSNVEVHRLDDGTWGSEGFLLSADATSFGVMATDGERVAACVRGTSGGWIGVFEHDGSDWLETERIGFPAACEYNDDLSLDGDTLAFGRNSRVEVYTRSGATTWSHEATLQAPAGSSRYEVGDFGERVSVDGDRIAVMTRATTRWVIRVFHRVGTTWIEEAVIPAPTNSNTALHREFELDGDLIAVGDSYASAAGSSAGAVFTFERGPDGWAYDAMVLGESTSAGDRFGISMGLKDGVLAVGACEDKPPNSTRSSGTAMVFEKTPAGWVEVALLHPTRAMSYYGMATSVLGDGSVVIGGSSNNHVHEYVIVPEPDLMPEVSAPDSSQPLRLTRAGDGLALQFEDLGSRVERYAIHAGFIGQWVEPELIACGPGLSVVGEPGLREVVLGMPRDSLFLLVGANGSGGAGRLGADWAGDAGCP